jgi:rhamnopyranosyl-N-acetylglucosaminyl-diphospho-decaprenol beta-1,3/1,4-galactofuranosyltransferase
MTEASHLEPVGAVFATYNRKGTAVLCLNDLLQQSRPLQQIVITVNGSQDGTADAIRELSRHHADLVQVVEVSENTGNPLGTWLAIERALELGCTWIWLLDDDARVEPAALQQLTSAETLDQSKVYGSLAIDPVTEEMSWPLGVIERDGSMRIASRRRELPSQACFEVRGIWLGALIPRAIFEQVGPLEADLFIRGEDEEYSARIRQKGHSFYCVKDSLVKHAAQRTIRIPIFCKNYFYQPNLPPWKAYYVVRNHAYIRKKYSSIRLAGIAKGIATVILSLACAVALDDQKAKRVRLYLKAGWDAFTDKMGRRVNPPY